MIIENLLNPIFLFITETLGFIPALPELPESLNNGINEFFSLLFENGGLVSFFIPMNVVKIAIPIALVIVNFDKIYSLFIWVLKKIPMLGIE